MTSIKNMQNTTYVGVLLLAILLLLSLGVILLSRPVQAQVQSPITTEMSVGSQGANVTKLQGYLASNPRIYPQGIVTGFYGGLTQAAVKQFQVAYDIASPGTPGFGRVGPRTLAQLNTLLTQGLPIDISAAGMSQLSITTTTSSATLTWATSEQTRSRIYYDTRPLSAQEAFRSFQEPVINGQVVSDLTLSEDHQMTLTGLAGGTLYYYRVVASDSAGNVSVSEQGTFSTK
ncbi:MAG: fibronectin type III domain-containing protein [Candidatus Pacebacteria bacterium]|nr:fibronectin type III domain-containing protein [Candidatus Paceibacterota bacterium]